MGLFRAFHVFFRGFAIVFHGFCLFFHVFFMVFAPDVAGEEGISAVFGWPRAMRWAVPNWAMSCESIGKLGRAMSAAVSGVDAMFRWLGDIIRLHSMLS